MLEVEAHSHAAKPMRARQNLPAVPGATLLCRKCFWLVGLCQHWADEFSNGAARLLNKKGRSVCAVPRGITSLAASAHCTYIWRAPRAGVSRHIPRRCCCHRPAATCVMGRAFRERRRGAATPTVSSVCATLLTPVPCTTTDPSQKLIMIAERAHGRTLKAPHVDTSCTVSAARFRELAATAALPCTYYVPARPCRSGRHP